MESISSCALCGGNNTKILARKGIFEKGGSVIPFTNVLCAHCGLVYLNPRPTEAETGAMYKKIYLKKRDGLKNEAETEKFLRGIDHQNKSAKILAFIKEYVKAGSRVLDIGAGLGVVMAYLRDKGGFDVHGIEPSEESVAAAAKFYKLSSIFQGTFEEYLARKSGALFDCLILHHVFEHFADPVLQLAQLEKLLSPRGIVYIEVPNVLEFSKPITQFFDYCHNYNYSPHTLERMLRKGGFKIIKWNREKKNRLQIVAAPEQSAYEALPGAWFASAHEAERIIAYCRKRRLHDFIYRISFPFRYIKAKL